MRKVYKKLVRDLVPTLIEEDGRKPETRKLEGKELLSALEKEFEEKLAEFRSAETPGKRLEKMADIFEVITALNEAEGRNIEEVISVQKKKREEYGAFQEKIWLEAVEEKE